MQTAAADIYWMGWGWGGGTFNKYANLKMEINVTLNHDDYFASMEITFIKLLTNLRPLSFHFD